MKRIIYLLPLIVFAALSSGCENDNPDKGKSIFVDPTGPVSTYDQWLQDNYVSPYNVRVLYRLEDVETDPNYDVTPARLQQAKEMSILMKHLWLEAYEEVAQDGIHFVRRTVPKLIHLIGSYEYDLTDGTVRLGVAEGGMKITITAVNALDPYTAMDGGGNLERSYFHTIHHEFAHVLHQTINYPTAFDLVTPEKYLPTGWQLAQYEEEYLWEGFITAYSRKAPAEDFVETISCYVTFPREEWNRRMEVAMGDPESADYGVGANLIQQKLDIAKTYMMNTWGVDLDQLYDVVQRRTAEVQSMDFENLDF